MHFRKRRSVFKYFVRKKTGAKLLDFFSSRFGFKHSSLRSFIRQHHFMLGFLLLALVAGAMGGLYDGANKKLAERPGSVLAANNWGGLAAPASLWEDVKIHGGTSHFLGPKNDIKLDSLNRPYIAWYDNSSGNYDIFFTHWDGIKWATMSGAAGNENLSNNAILSWMPRIAIDSANRPYVVWYDSNSGLGTAYITHWDGTKWAKMNGTAGNEAVPNTFTGNPKIDLDSADRPYIVWDGNVNSNIGLTRWDGTNWVKLDGTVGYDTVYSGASQATGFTEFSLDAANRPNIVWRNGTNATIMFTRWNGTGWVKMDGSAGYETVSTYGSGSNEMLQMALDSTGKPSLVWADSGIDKFTHWNGTNWTTMAGTIGTEDLPGGSRPGIAIDYNDRPYVVSASGANISFTRWDGIKWATMLGAAGREFLSGSSTALAQPRIAIDNSNNPHIAWYTGSRVYYSHWIPLVVFNYSLDDGGDKSVTQGLSVDNTITATLISGTTEPVTFSTAGLPAGAYATYSPPLAAPTRIFAMTLFSGTGAAGTYPIIVTGTSSSGLLKTTQFNLTINAAGDITAPVPSAGAPTGILPAGTTQTNLSLTTNENAICKYSTTANALYGAISNTFSTTGGTSHSVNVGGLSDGNSYNYYARCQDFAGNLISSVDGVGVNTGRYSSSAIGADGMAVISYYDLTNGDLKVAKCGNASCSVGNTITTVDSAGNVGRESAITIGADGNPIISYMDETNGDLKVAKCGNASCSAGNTITTVDSAGTVGRDSAIAINENNLPVISYIDATNFDLKFVRCGNESCTSGNIIVMLDSAGGTGYGTSIAVSDNQPVISYGEMNIGALKVVKCGNAFCSAGNILTILDGGLTGYSSSLKLQENGWPIISYYQNNAYDLKIAVCGNVACSSGNTLTTIDSTGSVGSYTSLVRGSDSLPIISYLDTTNSIVKVVKCGNSACSSGNVFTSLDNFGPIARNTSISVGADTRPVISYFDSINSDLKIVKCGNSSCSVNSNINPNDYTISFSVAAGDTSKPAIFINLPASFSTSTSPINISGTAVDY